MPIVRWRGRNIPNIFDELERQLLGTAPSGRRDVEEYEGSPAIDVHEDDENVTVEVALPGVTREDINISAQEDTMTIRGETSEERERDEEGYHVREMYRGHFSRTVTLPASIQPDETSAKFEDGVLTVTAPKQAAPTVGRKVEIE